MHLNQDPARKRASKKGRAKLSTQEPESDKEKSQEIEMANLRGQITILQQQLTSAHREIINMKVAKATTQVGNIWFIISHDTSLP